MLYVAMSIIDQISNVKIADLWILSVWDLE